LGRFSTVGTYWPWIVQIISVHYDFRCHIKMN
jgi:hypothetical protein